MKDFVRAGLVSVLASTSAAHAGGLMIPDSGTGDRVMLFSDVDGSLIDINWITDLAGTYTFTTPKEAKIIGKEIWVSDQVVDAIHRFDLDRNFLGSITSHFIAGASLDNLRGFGNDGTSVYLTIFPSTTANRGVVIFDYSGTPTGFFQPPVASNSLFDVAVLGSELLVANSTTDSVDRFTPAGAFLGSFATGLDFVQQTDVLPDGTVIAVSTIGTSGVEGVYHYNADGSLIRYIDTEPIKPVFGENVPRAAWVLQDGNYLIAGDGVYKYIVATNSFEQILADVDAQYINPIPLEDCPADINGDNTVGVADLLAVIGAWGACANCPPNACPEDVNADCTIGVADLLAVIGAWGACP